MLDHGRLCDRRTQKSKIVSNIKGQGSGGEKQDTLVSSAIFRPQGKVMVTYKIEVLKGQRSCQISKTKYVKIKTKYLSVQCFLVGLKVKYRSSISNISFTSLQLFYTFV